MKMLVMMALLVGAWMAGTGCNTYRGMGEDLEKMGDKMQDAAN
jgi:predicted small secreted protein